ncbi:DISARM system phospholipase D-like protein DrmC [Zoogloea sp.]|uniref:DISARM system phospholipase D-like protein DrmC n=1 Tax=Zoogloea sp. TaxID=49181 RepID=UPI002FE0BFB2
MPTTLLDICVRFVGDVSAEAVSQVIRLVETEGVVEAGTGLSGDAAQRYRELVRVWATSIDKARPSDVANILRGAAHAVASERRRQHVELVWSGPTVHSSTLRSTGPALLELIKGAKESIYLVTFAAYKVPEIAEAIATAVDRGVRVVFVLENEAVSGGKVTFDPLPHLRGRSAREPMVYVWPVSERRRDARGRYGTLHAKFAVVDRCRLLISSANLTEDALDLNIELGVLLTGGTAPNEAATNIDALIRLEILQRLTDSQEARV